MIHDVRIGVKERTEIRTCLCSGGNIMRKKDVLEAARQLLRTDEAQPHPVIRQRKGMVRIMEKNTQRTTTLREDKVWLLPRLYAQHCHAKLLGEVLEELNVGR